MSSLSVVWTRCHLTMMMTMTMMACACLVSAGPITFKNGRYDGVVVSVDENVPADGCRNILNNLQISLSAASQGLHTALGGRAALGHVTVLLPSTWPDTCAPRYVTSGAGESPDIRVGLPHPVRGEGVWTMQVCGCGCAGEYVYLSYTQLLRSRNMGRALVREWAKYRYGVFDEIGFHGDPVYPMCYHGDQGRSQVTGCSDLPIDDLGMCDSAGSMFNASGLINPEAKSSIMFAAESPRVTKFCDERTHDRLAPTKHNLLCGRRSTMEVILQHPDFSESVGELPTATNTTPIVRYSRRSHTRYVLVIEETMAMLVRESWSFLRFAVRKWAVYDLPATTEVGLVLCNDTTANRLHHLAPLSTAADRDLVAANIPYTPVDSHTPACLHCGLREAIEMLKERSNTDGPASSVIIIIAPGMDHVSEVNAMIPQATMFGIRITTINYPWITRSAPLDSLSAATGGTAYTVQEQRYNNAISYVSTYFKLANVMFDIASHFYEGKPNAMFVEIHRRELTDDGRSSVTGSFVLDESLGEPARFTVFTHSTENPLIRSIALVSPSQHKYTVRSDALISVKLITLQANINETGTWTYYIERFPGNPQPHFVQVMATPRSEVSSVVRARAWICHGSDGSNGRSRSPIILYTEVRRGDSPVLAAKVEVTVTRPSKNGTAIQRERFELMDTGSGDPDITRGDGVYTRYYSAAGGTAGLYTFDITVTDNGNTAYSWQENLVAPAVMESGQSCCGSVVPTPAVQPLSPFQRVLPPISVVFSTEDVAVQQIMGRIGDLRARVLAADLKARLSWTAPDMGGLPVARYELRYAHSAADIVERFETMGMVWEYGTPFPLSAGSDSTFTMDFTRNPSLLDQPLYIRMRAFTDSADDSSGGPASNWVRVLVPSPPPPPPPPSTVQTSTTNLSTWPYEDDAAVIPSIAQETNFSLELILPIVAGIALLTVCIAVYCYICVLRRRHGNSDKKSKNKHSSNGKQAGISSTTVTVPPPASVSSGNSNPSLSTTPQESNGVMPPQYESCLSDDKKRFSITHLPPDEPLNHQQHDSMVQQQHQRDMAPHIVALPGANNNGISTISNGGTGGTVVRGRTLSPFQSWTASQLLHEHERRHSPYGTADESSAHLPPPVPPPVPPLPAFTATHNGVYSAGPIYGVHPSTFQSSGYHRNGSLVPFNPSLQGSLSSVSSGDRKKRNVTMV